MTVYVKIVYTTTMEVEELSILQKSNMQVSNGISGMFSASSDM